MFDLNNFEPIESKRLKYGRLQSSDIDLLFKNLMSQNAWPYTHRGITDEKKFFSYMQDFLEKQKRNEILPLVVRLSESGEIAALSVFHNNSSSFTRVEIGYTWVAEKWMRTFVNTEMKLTMLHYAFTVMNVKRVEFSVDPRNEKSNAAMRRIGAQFEGTLRKWRFLSALDPGDRNIYSIIDDEWPQAEAHIQKLLDR